MTRRITVFYSILFCACGPEEPEEQNLNFFDDVADHSRQQQDGTIHLAPSCPVPNTRDERECKRHNECRWDCLMSVATPGGSKNIRCRCNNRFPQ